VADRSQIGCLTDGCRGVLGAWANGAYIPAGHLIGGRDWYLSRDGAYIRCTFCGTWHGITNDDGRLRLETVLR